MRRILRLWWYEGECSKEVLPAKRESGMAQREGWLIWRRVITYEASLGDFDYDWR
jgi:hypothetical protein